MEPPYQLIKDGLRDGRVIPFLGAGAALVERPANVAWTSPQCRFLPNASELADYLDRLSGFPSSETIELTRVAQYFDGVAGRGGLEQELRSIFTNPGSPGRVHRFVARSSARLIVTTNYDDLLEQAFREIQKAYNLVVYRTCSQTLFLKESGADWREVLANEMDLVVGETPVIFKMHGAVDQHDSERDSFVITEDDYVEFLTRLASKAAIPSLFFEPFRRSHFLFLGYGLRDWNLRVVLHKIWKDWPQRRFASWAIQNHTHDLERQFWSRRQLTIYEMSLQIFLDNLDDPTE